MSTSNGFVGKVLDETREEIIRADGKASIILASAGIAVGAVLAGLIAGSFSLKNQPGYVWVFTILAFVFVASGIVAVAAAVYPRVGRPAAGRARYFTEIGAYDDAHRADLIAALREEAADVEARDFDQLRDLSRLVVTKYRFTQGSLWLLGTGFLSGALASLLSIGTKT